MSSVTFNDLLSNELHPWLAVNKNGKFPGGSQEYLRKMYELSRESFLKRIRNEFQKSLFSSKSADQLKTWHKTTKDKSLQMYQDAVLDDWQLGRDGLVINLQVPLERKCEFSIDREEFASLKFKNLVILIEEKSGCMLFGTIFMVSLSTYVLDYCLKLDDKDNQNEEEEQNDQQENKDQNNNNYPITNEDDYEDEEVEDSNNDTKQKQEHNKENKESFQVKVNLQFNSNTFLSVLDKLKKGNKFIMFETVEFWLPEYFNFKALSYMIQNNIQIPFEDQILRGENPSENQFPDYEQNQTKPKEMLINDINSFIQGNPQLEEGQQQALKEMLNKNVCFVEGPPGTGKSFIAKQAVLNLLSSYSRVDCKGKRPILILSHKNISLDALLKSILESNQSSILRLGKSKDRSLHSFGIKSMLRKCFISKKGQSQEKQLNKLVDQLKNPIPIPNADGYKDLANVVKIQFSQLGVDLPSLLFKTFVNHFLPGISIEENLEQIATAKIFFFEQWIANDFGTSILEKLPEKYHKIDQKLQLYETLQYINKQFDASEFFNKPLINYALEDPNQRFCLKNNRTIDQSQQLIARLTSARNFYDFTFLKADVLNLTYQKVKQQLFHQLFCYYKQEYSEVQRLNTFQAGKVIVHKFRERKIIGMTLTRAMIIFQYLQIIRPEIVIIDEASEVKESQIACILQPYVKHIIQIGDYKQLSPIYKDVQFMEDHNIGNSQFERVITKLKNKSSKLKVQRRMAPQLSQFVRLVYRKNYYQDHISVLNKIPEKNIPCVALIDHKYREKFIAERFSMMNTFEAYFCIQYAVNLIKTQNIKCPQIAVITFYSAQVKLIQEEWNKQKRNNIREIEGEKDILINTVDEFQGKESDYIILSCVRSNDKNAIGFLNSPQRINVAFSRARLSLTILGNLELLYQTNADWKKRIELAKKQGYIVNSQNIQNYPLFLDSYQKSKQYIDEIKNIKQSANPNSSNALDNDEISNKIFTIEVSNYLNGTQDNEDNNNDSSTNQNNSNTNYNNNRSSEKKQLSIHNESNNILHNISNEEEQDESFYFSSIKKNIEELERNQLTDFQELQSKLQFMENQLEKLGQQLFESQNRSSQLTTNFLELLFRYSNIQEFFDNLHERNQQEVHEKSKSTFRTILFRQLLNDEFQNSFKTFKLAKKTIQLSIREYPQTNKLENPSYSLREAGSNALQSQNIELSQVYQKQQDNQNSNNNEEGGFLGSDDLVELMLLIVESVDQGSRIYQEFKQPYIFEISTSCKSIAVKGKWDKKIQKLSVNIFAQSQEIHDQWSGLSQVESSIQEVMNSLGIETLKVVFLLKMEDNQWLHYTVDLHQNIDIDPVSIRLKEHAHKVFVLLIEQCQLKSNILNSSLQSISSKKSKQERAVPYYDYSSSCKLELFQRIAEIFFQRSLLEYKMSNN